MSGMISSTTCLNSCASRDMSIATSLRSVFLYDNNLTGAFPPALGRCRQLQRLLLANNGFSGHIPAAALPQMKSLQVLDLSSNTLTDAIPPELGKLQALAGTLNISRNRLSDAVPPELGRLPATVTLDLRFNNLSGEIPQSGSLASQGATAFLNNPGLCGFPLQVPCRAAPPSASSSTPPPTTTGSGGSAGGTSQPMKTSFIVLISAADAAGVALIGVIVVYIYWKLRDRRGDDVDDEEDEEGRGLFACPCMRANTCGDSSDGSDAGGGEKKRGNGSGGGGGGEDGELVAIDKGFQMELDELLRGPGAVQGVRGGGRRRRARAEAGVVVLFFPTACSALKNRTGFGNGREVSAKLRALTGPANWRALIGLGLKHHIVCKLGYELI
ncbi:hypothetical protein VPH35_021355 [Triticum aestivum]